MLACVHVLSDDQYIKKEIYKMAFDKKLLEIIACPSCKGELVLATLGENEKPELVCKFDRLAYQIKDNIPVLLEETARELSLDEIESLR